MSKKVAGATNPRSEPDNRFDPESDDANARAHGESPKDKKVKSERKGEIQNTIQRSLERAVAFYESDIQPEQVKATEYYHGEPFGDEQDGRSKVVSMDVHDATQAQLPSLMRIFFGSENAVEFRAKGPEDEEAAEQITDFIRYVITEENDGFVTFTSAFTDALVRDIGVVKWWQDEFYRVEASKHTGLSIEQVGMLATDPEVKVEVTGSSPDGMTFNATVTRKNVGGCQRIAAVPPEEFVFTPNARSIDTAPLVAHVRMVAVDELLAMGIDEDLVEESVGKVKTHDEDMDTARNDWRGGDDEEEEDRDPSQRECLFAEAYALIDGDGDDRAELRMFQCVGPDFEIANGDGLGEIVDEIPFAVFTPELEPHAVIGRGNYRNLKDIQRIKSQILRGTLDSLAMAIEPKTEVVEGEVNMQDLLNPEINGIVRARRPGMMREISHSFVGPATLPMLDHMDSIKEERTGHTKAAAGLDADSLQSSTKAAVAATLSASQQRIEMIARIFAETGMKRLFRGLLRLVVKHQDKERMVRLRGKWVEIDPRHWDATMDVQVNVALGQGTAEDRSALLGAVYEMQKELVLAGSPLVSMVEIRNTLAARLELAGFKNADRFFKPWGPAQEQEQAASAAQNAPPPDPNAQLVEIEAMRVQAQIQNDQQKLMLEERKIALEDDRERDKMAREMALKEREIEAKFAIDINDAQLKAQVERDRLAMDADLRRKEAESAPQTEQAA